ncbi:reverse transcriptase domain-containing protein [Tanacetum coccineum]|uniref:Reverse transcriptase domain-containing protein n=1 Tax=Tanacetum coccineum TaxID=301880 RepID=A0ABQ5ATJ6_9ASTR
MLDSCTATTCMQSWGRMDYARALVDIRIDQALKDTMVISILNPIGNGVTMHTIKVEYEWKPPRCGTCLVFGHDDIQCPKRVMADLRKQGGMVDRALKDTMVISIPNPIGNGVTMHTIKVEYEWKPPRCGTCLVFGHDDMQCPKRVMVDLRKQGGTSNDGFQTVQRKAFCGPLVSKQGTGEDNGKPMDDLIDDTRKKVDASPMKTGI